VLVNGNSAIESRDKVRPQLHRILIFYRLEIKVLHELTVFLKKTAEYRFSHLNN
jgi:hypothetical protein